ncbi:MAG TPA: copper resistance protein NlpE N-terminal domain-containing protein [Candidatus Acidoferrales bacterium]|nr:copper resistance protein NlpE N-terminal domain-containing protein [Candidatus Acidoferrales bacterium]
MTMRATWESSLWWSGALALTLVLTLWSCAARRPEPPPAPPLAAPDARAQAALIPPVTFEGEIPCQACASMRRTLTLLADGSYRLRQRYESAHGGSGMVLHEVGRWTLTGKRLSLLGENGRGGDYQLVDSTRLIQSGRDGEPLTGVMAYGLSRAAQFDPIAEPMRVSGIYDARTRRLALCGTGQSLPVLGEVGDALALERMAHESGRANGLWVSVDAQWVETQRKGEAHGQPSLRIDRLWATRPSAVCPAMAEPHRRG